VDETVEKLLVLQRLDLEMDEARRNLQFYPERLAALRAEAAEKGGKLEATTSQLQQVERERRDLEGTLQLEEQRLQKSKSRLKALKTHYEFQALSREIESTRRANTELEELILKKMEEGEALKKTVEEQDAVYGAVRAELDDFDREAQARTAEYAQILKAKEAEVEAAKKGVDRAVLSKYAFIRHRKSGNALVAVVGGACQGCFMSLPPQQINEIMQKKSYGICPNCQRMIYVAESP
jgi:uncharacterized protein